MVMIKASDIMVPNPVQIKASATIREAIKLMEHRNIASLIVVDDTNGSVLGVITAKDIVIKVFAKGLDAARVRVGEIVSSPVTVVEPEAPLKTVVNLMIGTGHGHIPVVDKSGRAVGIVTVDDVLKFVPELLELLELGKKP